MGYQNQAWLDQWREPVIDPDQLICDPHHHLYPMVRGFMSVSKGHDILYLACNNWYLVNIFGIC